MRKVLLLGMGPTALSALDSLAARFQVAGVVRDVRTDGGATDEVARRAAEFGVPVLPDVSPKDVQRAVSRLQPDCTVVSSYDRVLGAETLRHCPFVNVHYAPLPEYRGRANVNWAIINGETESAITIHSIVPGLDAGNILYQERIKIGPDDTVGDLYQALNNIQQRVLAETVERHLNGYEGEPQDESAATYGCTRIPADGEIDWTGSTDRVYALVRALAPPYPLAYTYLGSRRISILRAAPLRNAPRYVGRVPGRVVARSRNSGHVDVLTGDGVLRLHEVVVDGSVIPASTIITSTRQTLGLQVADLLERIEALEARLAERQSG